PRTPAPRRRSLDSPRQIDPSWRWYRSCRELPALDLLDEPGVAVGILEGDERVVALPFWIGFGQLAALAEVEHLAGIDTALDEPVARGIEVGDAEMQAVEAPGSHLGVLHDRDRAGRAWWCHLHDAKVLAGTVVDEKIES